MSKRQQSVQFSTVAKVLLVSLFLGGSGVGYVLQKGQIVSLTKQRDKNVKELERLYNEQRESNAKLNRATTSANINAYLADQRVQMQQTDLRQVVTIPEPSVLGGTPKMSLVQQ